MLVLDDFHHVTDRAVLESFGQLLEHQPPQLRLVLAARADPALRLHRLRVNGAGHRHPRPGPGVHRGRGRGVVRAATGMHLSDGQLAVLLDRTEGWAAGLRLALMCLDPTDIDGGSPGSPAATGWSPNT